MLCKRALFLAFSVLSFFVIVACAPDNPERASSPDGGGNDAVNTYIIGDEQGDWGYPSPFTAYPRGPGYIRMSYLFDNLVWKDADGFVGALAEEWEFDKEELSYTFTLREGVKWHDGTSFSADDVVFTYRYLQEQPFPWQDLDMIDQVEKLDSHRVKIYLEEPYAPFLNNLAGVVPILPEHIWEEVNNPDEFNEPEAVIGTGPFILEEYRRDQGSYRYQANQDYYLGEPKVERLMMVKVSDPQMALQQGEVNYVRVAPEATSALEEEGFQVLEGRHDWCLKLMTNHREAPFDEQDFRQALAYALDLDELVERALRGHGLPGSPGLISPDSRWHCDELPDYSYDPGRAQEKLKELGYTLEDGTVRDQHGEVLSLEVLVRADYAREGEIVGEQLQQLGLEVNVRSAESSVVDQRVREWDFDLVVSGHGGVGGDPDGTRRFMTGEASPHNNARLDHQELREEFTRQTRALDQEEREEAVCRIQHIHAEELPAYPLHHPTWYYGHDGEVDWFFTRDGLGSGIPMPLNYLAFIE